MKVYVVTCHESNAAGNEINSWVESVHRDFTDAKDAASAYEENPAYCDYAEVEEFEVRE